MSQCPHLIPANYTSSIAGKFVYKDQCTKCFFEPDSEDGLDVCLKCFNGSCSSGVNHSQKHYQQTNHCLVLNLKKILIKSMESEEINPDKITKLGINVEGGANFQGDQYETISTLKCLACKIELDSTPIIGVVNSILSADSSYEKTTVIAWELDLKPCEHTKNLQQVPKFKLADNSLAHCGKCDLSNNLWLCLTCGHLGCGRKQADGSGGNGHGIQHFEETMHFVVVKMGTISPEGTASLYCYACNDDVLDESLPAHLENFGINVNRMEKTEKTMTEMNIMMNLNFQLSKAVEEGKVLKPVFGPELTGLQNIGNSCYLNSVIQVLFSLDEFQKVYAKEGVLHLSTCTRFPPDCFYCQFVKLGSGLISGKYSVQKEAKIINPAEGKGPEYYQDGVRPHNFKHLVGKGHPEFSTNKQQDAEEYWEHLLSYIKKSEKANNQNDITNIFNTCLSTKLNCKGCGGYKIRDVTVNQIKLPCPYQKVEKDEEYNVKFEDIIESFSHPEFVSGVFCSTCNKNSEFVKKAYVKKFPKYFVLPVTRFTLENWVPVKIQAYIQVPNGPVDFSRLLFENPGPLEFKLKDDQKPASPSVPEHLVDNLTMMGFGKNRATRALLANNLDLDMAMNWLLERMDDESLDAPLAEAKPSSNQGIMLSEENIVMITSMGFTDKQATFALKKTDNNVERAIDYLFNHPDETGEEEEEQSGKSGEEIVPDKVAPKYVLHAAIVHLGRSVMVGHYVCYIRRGDKWVLFNDSKVAETPDPVLGKASILIFRRV